MSGFLYLSLTFFDFVFGAVAPHHIANTWTFKLQLCKNTRFLLVVVNAFNSDLFLLFLIVA